MIIIQKNDKNLNLMTNDMNVDNAVDTTQARLHELFGGLALLLQEC